jgi:hypothetical protein
MVEVDSHLVEVGSQPEVVDRLLKKVVGLDSQLVEGTSGFACRGHHVVADNQDLTLSIALFFKAFEGQ